MERFFFDGKVNLENLQIVAKPLPEPMGFEEFHRQFETKGNTLIKSPVRDVKINVKSQYYKLLNWKENRFNISGAIKETIEDPLLIVNHKGAIKYYAPYVDKNNLVHIVSVTEIKNGIDILKSNYEPFNLKRLSDLLNVEKRDLLYIKDVGEEIAIPVAPTLPSHSNNSHQVAESIASKKIISKQAEFVNDIQQNTQIKKGNDMAANSNPTSSKKTYADHVSEKIIEAIEAGTAPWMRKWKGAELYGRSPYNGVSDKPYKGINAVNLMITANALGYSDPRWLTYKQAKSIDAQVKKGERGTVIQYWKFEERRDVVDDNGKPVIDENGKPKKETVKLENPKVFFSTVFNAEQIENMPELKLENPLDFKPNEVAENVLKNSGAVIEHKAGMSAYYMPGADKIVLPEKEQFVDEAGYYATALHELGHWTGHESRLNRDLSGNFGSESYAKEELRAEIASYMLSSKLGIDFDPGNHFSYVDSWLKSLKEDKHEIFRAARDAEGISDYVMDLSLEKNINQEEVAEKGITMTEAQHAWVQKKLDAGEPIYLDNNRVIMENLRGGTVESVKSEGLFVLTGEQRNMKPSTQLSETEAKEMILERYNELKFVHSPVNLNEAVYLDRLVLLNENKVESILALSVAKEFENLEKGTVNSLNVETMGLLESYAAAMNDQGLGVALLDHSNDDRRFLGEVTEYFTVLSDKNELYISFDDFMKNQSFKEKIENLYHEMGGLQFESEFYGDGGNPSADFERSNRADQLLENMEKQFAEKVGVALDKNIKLEDHIMDIYSKIKSKHSLQEENVKLEKQTYLFVPYSEKEAAKKAGAKWDKENKAWYAEKGTPSKPLEKWALENVKFDTLNLQATGDYMKDFVAELNARGFEVDHLETDGRIRNVKVEGNKGAEKSGAYAVHTDGRPVLWYKNHRTHETGSITHRESNFEAGADKKEIKKYEELNRIRILQRDKDTERMHNEVASRLQGEYQKLPSVQSHPYLQEKGIDQPDKSIKIDEKGSLLIPFVDANGEIKTVQRIPQQPREGKFPKYWEKDGEKSGNFALIGADKISEVREFVLCEGYATGETLHKALDMPVVVAGDSGNLSRVALKIIDANPDVKYKVTIAADNDVHITKPIENPGLTKAKETENEIKVRVEKVTLLKPTFSKSDREKIKNPSDFNDLEKVKGIDAVKSQIAAQRYARQRAEDIQKEKAQPNQTRSREPKKETAREMGR
ncbi:MAG: zincin-like metallopeptidase domain-containing protein [Sulfurovum sp.]|nr:zincin-like metallopeptidase domain-containing protein [Sulfurovum sp.]